MGSASYAPLLGDDSSLLAANGGPYKILEIFLTGGLSPWETFWVFGNTTGSFYHDFDCEVAEAVSKMRQMNLLPHSSDVRSLTGGTFFEPYLGPFTQPLWRPDILSKLRVVPLSHNILPHAAAIPYAMTGHRLGRASFAGFGTHVQRQMRAQIPASDHPLPFAYTLKVGTNTFSTLAADASAATGRNGGEARPLVLPVDGLGGEAVSGLAASLQRETAADPLLSVYARQYAQTLTPPGASTKARSRAFEQYQAALQSVLDSDALKNLFIPSPVQVQSCAPMPTKAPAGSVSLSCLNQVTGNTVPSLTCGSGGASTVLNGACQSGNINASTTALRLASYLLTQNSGSAENTRYVCVVDPGAYTLPDRGYDTHGSFTGSGLEDMGFSLFDTLSTLSDMIRQPQENAPDKLSLDDTLIVINTEFGRTPFRAKEDSPNLCAGGRDHWPQGYTSVLIGGGVDQGTAGFLDISDVDYDQASSSPAPQFSGGKSIKSHTPTDLRAAMCVAAGIDPLHGDAIFGVGDLSKDVATGADEPAARKALMSQLLGWTV